jgi:hypothetical protein
MSISVDRVRSVLHRAGEIVVMMESGVQICFPVLANPRLSGATENQLNHVEISPFGLHWPELDEDLSFEGLLAGDYGQKTSRRDAA